MTHKLKTEMFSQKIEYSGGVCFWPLTPLFSFVSFHLRALHHGLSEPEFYCDLVYKFKKKM